MHSPSISTWPYDLPWPEPLADDPAARSLDALAMACQDLARFGRASAELVVNADGSLSYLQCYAVVTTLADESAPDFVSRLQLEGTIAEGDTVELLGHRGRVVAARVFRRNRDI